MMSEEDIRDETIIQSYVSNKYFVSTIERSYDCYHGIRRGLETIVWEWDMKTKERGKQLYQTGSRPDHYDICRKLLAKGVDGLKGFEDE